MLTVEVPLIAIRKTENVSSGRILMNGDDDCSERDDGNVVVVKVYCNDDDGAWYWCPPKMQ